MAVMRALVDGALQVGGLDATVERLEPIPACVITRTSEADFASRQLEVSIDGEHVATLLRGDSVTRELAPGPHRLRVHNTLVWKTVEFTLGPEEHVFFEAINRTGPGTLLLLWILGAGPLYVSVERM